MLILDDQNRLNRYRVDASSSTAEMPKNLSDRLQKLENELQVLLMLQHVSASNTAMNKNKFNPKHSHVAMVAEMEKMPNSIGDTCPKQPKTQLVPLYPKGSGSTSCLNERFSAERRKTYLKYMGVPAIQQKHHKHEHDSHHKSSRSKRSYHYTLKKYDELHSYIENIQDNISKGTEAIKNIGHKERIDPSDMIATKPLENDCNKELACKYRELLKEIEVEQTKRQKVEQSVKQLRETLENNKAAIHDMIQSKKLALDMAKQLREKYDNIRTTRKETLEQIQILQVEKSTLVMRLEAETQNKKTLEVEVQTLKSQGTDSLGKVTKLQEHTNHLEEHIQNQNKLLQLREKELNQEKQKRQSKEDPQLKALIDVEVDAVEKKLKEKTEQVIKLEENCKTLEEQVKKLQEPQKILKEDSQVQEILTAELAGFHNNLEQKMLQINLLQEHCDQLEKLLKEMKEVEKKKCLEAEEEFQNMREAMQEKENLLYKERNELEHYVKELTDLVKQHKLRINELTAINEQQETLLQTHLQNLTSKEEQVTLANQEAEMLRKKSFDLQQDVQKLQISIHEQETLRAQWTVNAAASTCVERKTVISLEKELLQLRKAYDCECDKFRIQEKMIQDQNDTIHKLKTERAEGKKNREMLQCELEMERQNIHKMKGNILHLQRQNDDLINRIGQLEEEVNEVDRRPMQEIEQQQMLIGKLEKQVHAKQKEWELQLKLTRKEKEQAVAAAQFATQKLMETVNEFQKQIITQKKVQRMLTSLLSEKEGQLNIANKKVSSLTGALNDSTHKAETLKQRTEEKLRRARDLCSGAFHEISLKA